MRAAQKERGVGLGGNDGGGRYHPDDAYGLTAFACIRYFRNELFNDFYSTVFKLVFPLLDGLGLTSVLVVTLRDSASPDYGSGASIGGVGLVLILGLA